MTRRAKTKPVRDGKAYRQLWRIVEGAVADALTNHPDYVPAHRRTIAARSITKRVVGSVLGYAAQAAGGRSGAQAPAADG